MRASFPYLALWQEVQFHLSGQSLETQESISGADTSIPTMRGRWMATANFAFTGEAATLQWQAFLAQMQGRLGTTLVPARSRFRPKDRNGRALPFCSTADLVGGQTWEHFGFQNGDANRVVLAAAAPLRATELSVNLNDSTGLRPGQFFSIGERLHRVQLHWQPSGGHRVKIEPPLREAASAGARLEIERPVCRMRCMSETEGLFDQSLAVLPSVSFRFAEAV